MPMYLLHCSSWSFLPVAGSLCEGDRPADRCPQGGDGGSETDHGGREGTTEEGSVLWDLKGLAWSMM